MAQSTLDVQKSHPTFLFCWLSCFTHEIQTCTLVKDVLKAFYKTLFDQFAYLECKLYIQIIFQDGAYKNYSAEVCPISKVK